jgi:uncharacterized Tic20 family protein
MTLQGEIKQNDKVLAAVAHASILLGLFTSGIGGIVTALVIWLTQKEKSAYATRQALQALVYQVATFLLTMLGWCCWGILWLVMLLPPLISNPEAYEYTPPPGLWAGMGLMLIPLAIWGLTILYGLWAAVRCLDGRDFKYVVIGRWLEHQS